MKGFLVSLLFVIAGGMHSDRDLKARYPRIESYEIRRGVVAMPKYAANGDLCEVAIQKPYIQGGTVNLDTTMSHELVMEMINELIPAAQRGKSLVQIGGSDYITDIEGSLRTEEAEYENASVRIYGSRRDSVPGDLLVLVNWKKKDCPSLSGLKQKR